MISVHVSARMSYHEFRLKYVQRLIETHALGLNADKVWRCLYPDGAEAYHGSRPKVTYKADVFLNSKVGRFLFQTDGELDRNNLLLLLAGPEEPPRCFGGTVELRPLFHKLIEDLGTSTEDELCEYRHVFRYYNLAETAYWLMEQLNVRTCPFCNRQYVTCSAAGGLRPAFDHFFPKNKYPFLALSLFNLLPACDFCNRKKGEKAETPGKKEIIYPYDESFDFTPEESVRFRAVPQTGAEGPSLQGVRVLRGENEAFDLEFWESDLKPCSKVSLESRIPGDGRSKRIRTSIHTLKLESIYQTHKPEARKLLRDHYCYNRFGILSALSAVPEEGLTQEQRVRIAKDRLFFANLEKQEWGAAPLNKLKADLLDQVESLERKGKDTKP